jgi:hypothetical protein
MGLQTALARIVDRRYSVTPSTPVVEERPLRRVSKPHQRFLVG